MSEGRRYQQSMSQGPSLSWRSASSGALLAGAAGLLAACVLRGLYPWFLEPPWLAGLLLLLFPCALGALITARGRLVLPRTGWMLGALVWAFAGLLWLPKPTPQDLRMLVVGIDGATWDVIDPMIERGELPNLAALRDRGAHTVLRSTEPMHSPRLWTTIATGKPPAQHGVAGFRVQATDCRAARFWDVAEHHGRRIGIHKWLVTYPPRELDGFMVPGWLAPAPDTWPQELGFAKSLELGRRLRHDKVEAPESTAMLALRGIPHGLRLGTIAEAAHWMLDEKLHDPSRKERMIALQRLRARIDRDVFVATVVHQDVALATFAYYATDALSHHFWEHHQPEAFDTAGDPRYAEVVRDAYREADAILGDLLELTWEDSTVAIFSDHGFQPLTATGGSTYFRPRTEALQRGLDGRGLEAEVARVGAKLALTPTDGVDNLDALEASVTELEDDLGQPLYRVERMPGSLGLTIAYERLTQADLSDRTVAGSPLSDFVGLSEGYSGEHAIEGIFLLSGPQVPAGTILGPMEQIDVSPTLQALLNLRVAQDLPGRVMIGSAEKGPESWDHLVEEHRFVDGAAGVDEEQLRALGYVE